MAFKTLISKFISFQLTNESHFYAAHNFITTYTKPYYELVHLNSSSKSRSIGTTQSKKKKLDCRMDNWEIWWSISGTQYITSF